MSDTRQVIFSPMFIRRADRLSKKHRHIHDDVDEFTDQLKAGGTPGDRIQGTGDHVVYKARIASSDMQRGKSGGFRIIYYLRTETTILLLTIYPKTEQDNISAGEVLELIDVTLEGQADTESSDTLSTMSDPD